MQISHTYKFIHFANPKTASQSSWRTFRRYVDIVGVDDEESPYQHHVQPLVLKKAFPELWDSYFKFCFVRNPWSKVVSHYFYGEDQAGNHDSPSDSVSFFDFIKYHVLIPDSDCEFCKEQNGWSDHVNYVARFENYEEEIHKIFKLVGINEEPKIFKINSSKHNSYIEYYDDTTIMMVYEKFNKDIEMYNYEFGT